MSECRDMSDEVPNGLPSRIAQALSHPHRIMLLAELEKCEASVGWLAKRHGFGNRPDNTSYHLRVLEKVSLVEVVGRNPSGGSVETIYRAVGGRLLDPVDRAGVSALFDLDESLVLNWREIEVDGLGWDQVVDLLLAMRFQLTGIEEQSKLRAGIHGEELETLMVGIAAIKPLDRRDKES